MAVALLALTLILLYFSLIKPVGEAQQARAYARFKDQYSAIKLKYVRVAYQQQVELPHDPYRRKSLINSAYDSIPYKR